LSVTDPKDASAGTSRRQLPSPRQLRPIASLWPYIGRYPGMLVAAIVALVASAAATLAVPLAVRGMIDHGFSGAGGAAIDGYFATLVGLGLALAVASAARMYAVNWLGERVVADLRTQVFGHLATLGPGFFETTHSGEVMSRLTADTTQIKTAAGSALSQALRNLIMLVGTLVMMVVTSPSLSALALAAIPLIVFPFWPMAGPCSASRVRPRTGWPTPRPMPPTIWGPRAPWWRSARRRPSPGASAPPWSAPSPPPRRGCSRAPA
jgi:ABC-type multidrug transport system fused ATPase/permease subunit